MMGRSTQRHVVQLDAAARAATIRATAAPWDGDSPTPSDDRRRATSGPPARTLARPPARRHADDDGHATSASTTNAPTTLRPLAPTHAEPAYLPPTQRLPPNTFTLPAEPPRAQAHSFEGGQ